MANYLVTGGAGFIGSHLAEALLHRGHTVRIADSLITGSRHNVPKDVDFLHGDLADLNVAQRAVDGMDYVLHQAAIPSVPRSVKNPIESHRANVEALLNVLVSARDAGVRRVVFAGSSSVYGDSEMLPKREDMPTSPLSPYALQKLVGEQYCQLFTRLYGLETVTTRYFNVFGPRQDPSSPYSGVISLFITALLSNQRPVVHGDGTQTRDFTYVSNVVDGVLLAAETRGVAGEVFNIATSGRTSLNDLLTTLKRIAHATVEPIYAERRSGDVRDSQADVAKAEQMLGYRPTVTFEDGLRRTVAWFQTQAGTPVLAPPSGTRPSS